MDFPPGPLSVRMPAAGALLAARLGPQSRALPFAGAVVAQLATGEERARQVAEVVAELLGRCERAERHAVARRLLAEPELLASFFQNVDLLYDHGYPHADAVSLAVMEAVGGAADPEDACG